MRLSAAGQRDRDGDRDGERGGRGEVDRDRIESMEGRIERQGERERPERWKKKIESERTKKDKDRDRDRETERETVGALQTLQQTLLSASSPGPLSPWSVSPSHKVCLWIQMWRQHPKDSHSKVPSTRRATSNADKTSGSKKHGCPEPF